MKKKQIKIIFRILTCMAIVLAFYESFAFGMTSERSVQTMENMDTQISAHEATAIVGNIPGALDQVSGEAKSQLVEQVFSDSKRRYKACLECIDAAEANEVTEQALAPISEYSEDRTFQILSACSVGAANIFVLFGSGALITAAGAKKLILASSEMLNAPCSSARIAGLGLVEVAGGLTYVAHTLAFAIPRFVGFSVLAYVGEKSQK